eukprot:COSAG04_NODE_487_length_13521_cov_4.344360_5_plen_280_part_00
MRYIVLGAGALGGSIGARLALGGCDVALVARGEHLAALQSAGLRLREPEHDRTVATPAFASVGEVQPPIGSADVVILAVKVQGAAAALAELAALTAGDSPAVVCCTNGIDAERQALRHFERTYAMLPCMFATHLEPGHCEMSVSNPCPPSPGPPLYPGAPPSRRAACRLLQLLGRLDPLAADLLAHVRGGCACAGSGTAPTSTNPPGSRCARLSSPASPETLSEPNGLSSSVVSGGGVPERDGRTLRRDGRRPGGVRLPSRLRRRRHDEEAWEDAHEPR